ncbi:MAG: LytR/AlgR family response regulator transcription factor [Aquincola tertiaricarbonis]|uniref:LytR/AlgR family response regulator transcription factor n=1 Tax=Aquincola sp. J276 TaxID=2898432 RepID=UPI002151AFA1|nr:LytTR family DNA-binding domain-containing protein [Aquincola sp. J276]MCR5868266.1 LytTR family DNA-binding domain-containing protein [Aquincola sp. J276]
MNRPTSPALRLLIVDDEPLARLRLATLVRDCAEPRCEVAAEAANGAQALAWLKLHPCDAVLLDVQMPGASGMQLAAELKQLPRVPAVVFVTAHADHALQAFELEAVDYLTKPVRRERLQAALQRVAQRLARYQALPPEVPALVVTERGRVWRVPLAEVLYLKAELKYVTLRTAQRSYVLDESLTELAPRLGERFLRIHRNALVARDAVRALERRATPEPGAQPEDAGEPGEGWAAQVAPTGEWLAVSRRQLAAVREAIEAARW